jgi:hypothetical protein
MRYFYALLFAVILFPSFSYGQSNYKPGLVVTIKGDTVRGFIDHREWENNPANIRFKKALNTSERQYGTGDITYFRIDHFDAYRRYNGPISMDDFDVNHLSSTGDTSFKIATVFLKIEQDGQYATLYSYSDNLKKRYFVAEKTDNKPVELIYRLHNIVEQGSSRTIAQEKYKGQLIYLAAKYNSNSDALRTEIERAGYNNDLVGVMSKINRSGKQDNSGRNPGSSFYVGISSGANAFKAPKNLSYHYTNSYLPRVSIGVNAYTNPDVGTLVVRGEIGFFMNNNKTYFNASSYSDGTKPFYTINQYNFSLSPQLIYNLYNTNSFKFYVNAGASLNLSKYSNTTNYNFGSHGSYKNSNNLGSLTWLSIPLSTGITLQNKIGIFVSYTIPTIIDNNDTKFSSEQIGINYIFGHRK